MNVSPFRGLRYVLIDGDPYPHIDPQSVGPMMYDAVVRSVCVKCFRTYADRKCSEDFHVSVAEEEAATCSLLVNSV
jgi:hypothetical protein